GLDIGCFCRYRCPDLFLFEAGRHPKMNMLEPGFTGAFYGLVKQLPEYLMLMGIVVVHPYESGNIGFLAILIAKHHSNGAILFIPGIFTFKGEYNKFPTWMPGHAGH